MRNKMVLPVLIGIVIIMHFLGNTRFGHSQVAETINIDETITELKTNVEIADIVIETAETNMITVEIPEITGNLVDHYEFDVDVDGGLLLVESRTKNNLFNNIFDFGSDIKGPIRITLPHNTELEQLDIVSNMGSTYLNDLFVQDANIELDMGTLSLADSSITNADINVSMGSFEISQSIIYNSTINVDMGSIEGDVALLGAHELVASMGSIELDLLQSEDNTQITTDISMGDVITRTGLDLKLPEQSANFSDIARLELEVSMGDIELHFID